MYAMICVWSGPNMLCVSVLGNSSKESTWQLGYYQCYIITITLVHLYFVKDEDSFSLCILTGLWQLYVWKINDMCKNFKHELNRRKFTF